jgi:hypothetical protein
MLDEFGAAGYGSILGLLQFSQAFLSAAHNAKRFRGGSPLAGQTAEPA